ncbi:MAG: metallophosphatase family protein [Chitinophagales bacterium]|nr:metallophosphatase family protein [Chitinophagales bacterium]MCZ2393718.1 metallophosphatase family protein [Chitinophagales bacterium]
MKRIGLLSDTHSYLDSNLKNFFSDCDEIWHAGDIGNRSVTDELATWGKIRAVYGNIDDQQIRLTFPEFQIIQIEQVKILIIHIAGSLGTYNVKIRKILEQNKDISCLICGHSHILKIKFDIKFQLWYINPGAAGHHGFHHVRTALKMDIHHDKIENIQLIELGKRGRILS